MTHSSRLKLRRPSLRHALKLGLFSALAVLQTACGIEGSGVIVERSQETDGFDSISVSDSFEATVKDGDEFGIVIRADDNIIDDIRIHQDGQTVSVDLEDTNISNATLQVEFTLPELRDITLSDSSMLDAEGVMIADEMLVSVSDSSHLLLRPDADEFVARFTLECEDSSNCEAGVMADQVRITADDSSHIALHGGAEQMELTVKDSSAVHADDFDTSRVRLEVKNSSSAVITATETVTGVVSNSSSAEVAGGADVNVDVNNSSSLTEK